MQFQTRMPAALAGWTCLLFVSALSLGCSDSHSKQQAQSSDSAAAQDPAPQKKSDAETSANHPPKSLESELGGITHPWKAGSSANQPSAKQPATTPAAARTTTVDDDDRYANARRSQSTGASAQAAKPPADPPGKVGPPAAALPLPNDPTAVIPAATPAAAPGGNPLRDEHGPATTGRPQDPPPPVPSPAVDPAPAQPSGSGAASSQGGLKSELTIQDKPEHAGGPSKAPDLSPAPVGPAAPSVPAAEPRQQPKEHTLGSVRPGPRTNKNSGIPFDPLKENGPIFVGWPKPKVALVITGQQEGYLEPCGCAGLDRMKGGMSRRYSLFRMLRDQGWPVIGMDVGGTAKGFSKQAEIKFQISVNSMDKMRYSSAALGRADLLLPTEEVLSQTMPVNNQTKTMFVCGNVGLFAFDEAMLPRTQLISTGFKMIGVTSIVGKTYLQELSGNANLKTIPPEQLLDEAVPLLKTRAKYMVMLAHATHKEAVDLAVKYPDFNLIVCSDGGAEPPSQPETVGKGAKLIEVGEKGMYAAVIGLYDDPQQPLRYQRVTLDSRFKSSPEMVALMSAYQDQLKVMGLSGLGIRPLQHPLAQINGRYVGSAACQNCHEESYRVWKKTPHSRAFAVLKDATPPRNFDPECVSCHTVGWNPQKFFPYASGYLSEKETPKLTNVGCEDCHGPGEKHCWAENHGTAAEQVAYRKTVVLTEEEAANPNCPKQNCWSCHDLDNSPEFKFNLYFPFVKHYERE